MSAPLLSSEYVAPGDAGMLCRCAAESPNLVRFYASHLADATDSSSLEYTIQKISADPRLAIHQLGSPKTVARAQRTCRDR